MAHSHAAEPKGRDFQVYFQVCASAFFFSPVFAFQITMFLLHNQDWVWFGAFLLHPDFSRSVYTPWTQDGRFIRENDYLSLHITKSATEL